VPLPLALAHQAVAMLVLTIASLHAANVMAGQPQPLSSSSRVGEEKLV